MKALQAIVFVCALLFTVSSFAQTKFSIEQKSKTKLGTEIVPAEKIDAPFDRLQGEAWALVLTGSELDPFYIEQYAMLEPQAETLKARDIVVIHFNGRTLKTYPDLSVYDYKLPSLNGSKRGRSSHDKIKSLEGQLRADDDIFSVVLVDKDGRTVYVWREVVKPSLIYQMMDHPVPMPAQESPPQK